MNSNHDVICDQDEYAKNLRPIVHPELTGQAAEREATKTITDLRVSLRGAIAYTRLTPGLDTSLHRGFTTHSDTNKFGRTPLKCYYTEITKRTTETCFQANEVPR